MRILTLVAATCRGLPRVPVTSHMSCCEATRDNEGRELAKTRDMWRLLAPKFQQVTATCRYIAASSHNIPPELPHQSTWASWELERWKPPGNSRQIAACRSNSRHVATAHGTEGGNPRQIGSVAACRGKARVELAETHRHSWELQIRFKYTLSKVRIQRMGYTEFPRYAAGVCHYRVFWRHVVAHPMEFHGISRHVMGPPRLNAAACHDIPQNISVVTAACHGMPRWLPWHAACHGVSHRGPSCGILPDPAVSSRMPRENPRNIARDFAWYPAGRSMARATGSHDMPRYPAGRTILQCIKGNI